MFWQKKITDSKEFVGALSGGDASGSTSAESGMAILRSETLAAHDRHEAAVAQRPSDPPPSGGAPAGATLPEGNGAPTEPAGELP